MSPRSSQLLGVLLIAILWQGLAVPSAAAARGRTQELGNGFVSKCSRSLTTGKVIKKIKPTLGARRTNRHVRVQLAKRTVSLMKELRDADIPVPQASWRAQGATAIIEQDFALGSKFSALNPIAKLRAVVGVIQMVFKARAVLRSSKYGIGFVDPVLTNFRFDKTGRVASWFDPVHVIPLWRWIQGFAENRLDKALRRSTARRTWTTLDLWNATPLALSGQP